MDPGFLKSDFWFDRPNAVEILEGMQPTMPSTIEVGKIRQFIERGYLVLEGAVESAAIDDLNQEIAFIRRNPRGFFTSHGHSVRPLEASDINKPLTKLLDLYVKSNNARRVLLSRMVRDYVKFLFQDNIRLFQSLYFWRGSTQDVHQDATYVVVEEKPHNFVAAWVALEDISENSGELVYLEDSHREVFFPYPEGRVHWKPHVDGNAIHDRHLSELRNYQGRNPEKLKYFRPRKGDVLLWHSNLAHGGSKTLDPDKTRQSIVGHMCPVRSKPHYCYSVPGRFSSENLGICFDSLYYDNSTCW